MGEVTPEEHWVKDSDHRKPKRAGLKSGLKDSDKMVASRLNLPVSCTEFGSIQTGLYNGSTADIL